MSKDYRYQRDEWDSVDDVDYEDSAKKGSQRRHHEAKTQQKRDMQRREKQRRTHFDEY